jgi:hypothetical protein
MLYNYDTDFIRVRKENQLRDQVKGLLGLPCYVLVKEAWQEAQNKWRQNTRQEVVSKQVTEAAKWKWVNNA